MSDDGVVIEHGLPDDLRDQAVKMYEDAFGEKMSVITRDTAKRMIFTRRSLVASNCIVARRDGTLLGIVGLSTKGEPHAGGLLGRSWDPRPFRDVLGWLGSAWAVWGSRMAEHRPKDDEVYVDGIVVSPDARGLGIGTRLLDETTSVARANGKAFVRLDVIDRNPRAQALYERLGYKVTKVQSFRYQERWVGFGGIISMEQPVLAAPSEPEGDP